MYASTSFFEELRERVALERRIAYDAARTEIEVNALEVEDHPVSEGEHASAWYDTQEVPADDVEWIAERVRYLDLRGLLQRWPGSPHIVRVLDEPEEPAGHGEHAGKVD